MAGAPMADPTIPSASAVLTAFGLPGAPRGLAPLAGAWSHRVFRLDTSCGAYAVKQLMNPWRESGWRQWLEQAWTFELAASRAGIAMPRPVPSRSGTCLADVELADAHGHAPVRVHHWVDSTPCPAGAVDDRVAGALGTDLARMHALAHLPTRTDVFPVPGRASVDAWPGLIDRVGEHGSDMARRAATITDWVGRLGLMFDAADSDTSGWLMSHGDVDQKNVLLTGTGPALCDWDVAAPWAPRAELARTAMSLACWRRPEVARGVISAYRDAGGDDSPVVPDDLVLDLTIGLDWLSLCLGRASGVVRADDDRRRESRDMLPSLLDGFPRRVRTTLDVEAWLARGT